VHKLDGRESVVGEDRKRPLCIPRIQLRDLIPLAWKKVSRFATIAKRIDQDRGGNALDNFFVFNDFDKDENGVIYDGYKIVG